MTLNHSFQTRIAGVLILLLVVVVGALYFAVKAATGEAVHAQLREDLGVGGRVFERLLTVRGRQLSDAVQVLAADFGFKDAVASRDHDTIHSALTNHGARINASVALLLSLNGSLQVSTDPRIGGEAVERMASQVREQAQRGAQTFLLPLAGEVYLLVETYVTAPLPIARLVMGFRIDEAFAEELRDLTHLELTLISIERGEAAGWVSTLPPSLHARLREEILAQSRGADASRTLDADGERYLGSWLTLADGADYQVLALLHKSLEQAEEAFAPLDRAISLIALGAFFASLLGALLLARSLAQPVQQLARAAERIGQGDYETPVELARNDELGSLAQAVNTMQQGIAERERQLAHNALHDSVTGLPNRTLALERLGSAIDAARPTALLYIGLGNSRSILESCGAEGLDLTMQQLTRRLQATLKPGDTLARLVTDELLLLLEHCDSDAAIAVADNLQTLLQAPMRVGALDVALDCSIGIAAYPSHGTEADHLLRRAAIAMQDAAQQPGRLQLYQQGRDDAHLRQVSLVRDLRHAAANGELMLHYQPKLDLVTRQAHGAEALLRWQHPQYGLVSPGEFIPLAERTGSIQLLTAWVIEEALRQLRLWNQRGLRIQVSLNISAEDLVNLGLADRIGALLVANEVAAEQLVLEITESAMMQDPGRALEVLERLRRRGVQLSVDDFGTGYSSLAQLKRMPVQELKIDQAFIRDLGRQSEDAVIVRSTIEMSHSLGLRVVAEGIEHQATLELLAGWGCDIAQGYLIGKPVPASALEQWLQQWQGFSLEVP